MNCRRARPNIALWIGNDLDEQSEQDVRRHLAVCPQCREYAHALRTSLRVLEQSERMPGTQMHDSVWPDLSKRLRPAETRRRSERFNGWMPALAVVAACLTLVLISNNTTPQGAGRPAGDELTYPPVVIRVGNPDVQSVRFPVRNNSAAIDFGGLPELFREAARDSVRSRQVDVERPAAGRFWRVRASVDEY